VSVCEILAQDSRGKEGNQREQEKISLQFLAGASEIEANDLVKGKIYELV
jgi:hypothetical protein